MAVDEAGVRAEVERYLKERLAGASPVTLPTFGDYTVDFRLREFRKAKYPEPIEFVPFDSARGARLLQELWESLQKASGE